MITDELREKVDALIDECKENDVSVSVFVVDDTSKNDTLDTYTTGWGCQLCLFEWYGEFIAQRNIAHNETRH